jgi:protein-L-isoaspartate(D-aspartate) O-methyltransferase
MRPKVISPKWTADADPRHLYRDVLVAIEPERQLNNGSPSSLALWLDALELQPGEHVVHVGCGTGYYSAVMAEVVGPRGRVTAYEVDVRLAELARANLSDWAQIQVVHGNGAELDPGPCDAIFVNAGMTHPVPAWTENLRVDGGRMVLPVTFDQPTSASGMGAMFLLRSRGRRGDFAVNLVSPLSIFSCAGARDAELNTLLREAFARGGEIHRGAVTEFRDLLVRAGVDSIRTLRVAPQHAASRECWLHTPRICYSALEAPDSVVVGQQ